MRIREARLIEPGRIEVFERDLEVPPGHTLVEIAACGFCMTDVHKYLGHDPDVVLPVVLGHEASGVVVEANPSRASSTSRGRPTSGLATTSFWSAAERWA